MELVILGSGGGPQPSAHRASPSVAIVHDGAVFIVDAGNGVANQAVAAGLRLRDLRGVFITHHHNDHNADYGNLIGLAWTAGLVTPVQTIGPVPLSAMTDEFVQLNRVDTEHRQALGRPSLRSLFVPSEVTSAGVVYDAGGLTVTAARVTHPPLDAFAYRFDSANGSIVVSGDTAPCDSLIELAKGADILVHEAYSPDDMHLLTDGTNAAVDRLMKHFHGAHTTAEDAGRVAEAAGVRCLALWHLIPRAGVTDGSWVEQASRHFGGVVVASSDLLRLDPAEITVPSLDH
ncbi:MBL fold metallo-hydrolase [Flexivirga alba]|uniref:MBL fold metallo-hydrolase n=1 Tax=Flexivirga alba TaxID=702742 RepID=A0ABW2ABX7_9MICO